MESRRQIRPASYGILFLLFACLLFFSHSPFINLPYFWDEAGQYIPAALDVADGHFITRSATPTVHPPGLAMYLALFWGVVGEGVVATRLAMLLLAAAAVLAGFLLSVELCREVAGSPAFLAAALLAASPVFFAQSMLAQLDLPAALFTSLALLMFLQNRVRECVAACCALVLMKETGVVVPLVFGSWLLAEGRRGEARWFAAPVAVLACWIALVWSSTGHPLGSAWFQGDNLLYSLHPLRLPVALLRRLYSLFVANLHWVGTAPIALAVTRSRIFHSRSWRVAWTLVAAHVVLVSVLGGAVLERYLLPVLPVLYTAMVAGFSRFPNRVRTAAGAVLLAGVAVANLVNPPYPFPYENNIACADFLHLHMRAAEVLELDFPGRAVTTAWPLTAELTQPRLGFVTIGVPVRALPDFSRPTLAALDWSRVDVLVLYSRTWDPPYNLLRWPPLERIARAIYDYAPPLRREEARGRIPLRRAAHFERRGQWIDIYARPSMGVAAQ